MTKEQADKLAEKLVSAAIDSQRHVEETISEMLMELCELKENTQ